MHAIRIYLYFKSINQTADAEDVDSYLEFIRQNFYVVLYPGVFQDFHMQFGDVLELLLTVRPHRRESEHENRVTLIAQEVEERFGKGFSEIIDKCQVKITKRSTLKWLIQNRVVKSEEIARFTL